MATLKEARGALDYLQGRIDAGSMAGERLAVIAEFLSGGASLVGAILPAPADNATNAKIIGTSCSMVIADDVHPTEEETARAHEFFAEVGAVKASDHVMVTFGPVTDAHRAERRAPSTTVTFTGATLTILPAATTFDPLDTLPTFEELRVMHNDLMARSLSIPRPYNTTTDLATHACANCIEQGIIQPGCDHD